jgi:phosphoglycolate phosphatase
MAEQRFGLILFDLDGTLIDSAPDLCQALAQALNQVGLPSHDVDAVRSMIGEGQRILVERAIVAAGGELALTDDVLGRFRSHYSAHLVEETTLYPGVRETLSALASELPLAIATNKPGEWARRIIATFGLQAHFRWVLGEDDVGARKPDPRLLLSLCERAGVLPGATLMVGDSAIDLAAAAAARTAMALCTYGFGDSATLAAAQLDCPQLERGTPERPYLLRALPEVLPLVLGPQALR